MYIAEMIHERESAVEKSERHDLLSNLLEANDHDANRVELTESELICMFCIQILSLPTNVERRIFYSEYLYFPRCWT